MQEPVILGVGAALMDLLIEEKDEFLRRMESPKGGMTLVELPVIEEALAETSAEVSVIPGGSACNSIVGVANMGGKGRMIGRIGKDEMGEAFSRGLRKAGVEGHLASAQSPTGRVLSVVTPDAQRTMFTYLGASAELVPEDVSPDVIQDASILLLEGYLLFNQPVVRRLLELAKGTKAKVAPDLASFQVIQACGDFLAEILPSIDIIIANEDEAKAFTGKSERDALEVLALKTELAIVKLGRNGSLIARGKERVAVNAFVVNAIDTTGAGDLWAAGFFKGLMNGLDLERCALLGSKVASEVVQVMGAVIPDQGWTRIRGYMRELGLEA